MAGDYRRAPVAPGNSHGAHVVNLEAAANESAWDVAKSPQLIEAPLRLAEALRVDVQRQKLNDTFNRCPFEQVAASTAPDIHRPKSSLRWWDVHRGYLEKTRLRDVAQLTENFR
jgi:hypothetical protein